MKYLTRSSCLIHVLLYFTGIGGVPVRPSSALCAIHFEAGSIYHYTYITDVTLNEAEEQNYIGAHRPVGFGISSDLKLSVVWKKSYDYLIKLEVTRAKVDSVAREGITSSFNELQRYPVYFHWHGDGTVGKVYLPMNEKTISANLKKGIISLLQLQTVDGERTEIDASGECKVEYLVTGNKVTKTKTTCNSLEKSGQYQQYNQILDSERVGVTTTTYEFANDVVTRAESTDKQTVILNADRSIDIQAQSRQILTLKETTHGAKVLKASSLEEAADAADPGSKLDLVGMLLGTDIDSPTCLVDCISLKDAIKDAKDDLMKEVVAKVESPKAFAKLLPIFRQSSKEVIKDVLLENTDIQSQLLDLVAATQTDSAVDAAMEVLDFKSAQNYEMAERFVMAASFSTHPRPSLLKALLKLFNSNLPSKQLRESVALSLGAATRSFCQAKDQCAHQIVKDVEKTLLSSLEKAETVESEMLLVVRSLRNARLQNTRDTLIKVAESSKASSVSSAAIQALSAINKDVFSLNVVESMSRIYHQNHREYDSSVRSAALSLILESKPTVQQLRNVVISTINQTDIHLATYVLQNLQNLAKIEPSFNEKFQSALNSKALRNYNIWSPGGKANSLTNYLGRSQSAGVPYHLFLQNAKTGIMKKSGMLVSLQNDVQQQPLLLFSINAGGLESFVDSSAVPEGSEPEDATAGLSLYIIDVLLRPIEFFRGSSELMSAVWNAPSEPVTALAMNVLTQDKKLNIHLQNGLVLEHAMTGVGSIKISGFVKISLWNQDAQSVIKNSGGTFITGGLSLANNNYLSAAVNFNLQAETFIDFSTDVNFYVTPPQACLRMALNPFTIRETWNKREEAKGFTKRITFKLTRTLPIPGASYLLSKENSIQCTKLLGK